MGLKQAQPMTKLIDAAQRLRMVRAARRRFLVMWAYEVDMRWPRHKSPRLSRGTEHRSDFRQLRLFDDLN